MRYYLVHVRVKASQLGGRNSGLILPTGLPNFCINYLVEWMTHGGVPLYGDGQGEVDVGRHEDVGQGQHVGHQGGEHQGRGDAAITTTL